MNRIISALLIFAASLTARAQVSGPFFGPIVSSAASSGSCTPPTMTARWATYNTLNTCNGGSACSSGLGIDTWADLVASNNANAVFTSVRPIYTVSQVNGLPAAYFNSVNYFYTLNTPIPDTVTTYTFYAVLKPGSTAATQPLLGDNGGGSPLIWFIDSNFYQHLQIESVAEIGTNTGYPVSTSAYSTIAFTYNTTSGAYAFYNCASGTCTLQGSGTNAHTPTGPIDGLGIKSAAGFGGYIAEMGYLNGTSVAGIAAWSQCKYGY